jgi:hypothetical protein
VSIGEISQGYPFKKSQTSHRKILTKVREWLCSV